MASHMLTIKINTLMSAEWKMHSLWQLTIITVLFDPKQIFSNLLKISLYVYVIAWCYILINGELNYKSLFDVLLMQSVDCHSEDNNKSFVFCFHESRTWFPLPWCNLMLLYYSVFLLLFSFLVGTLSRISTSLIWFLLLKFKGT